ncbi:MAG: polyprenyl synthetase family protein [Bacteroidales bacterium]|nr:polyprenyl synthetase family protein [Candidatus Colimorpha onthohippi]
MYSTSQLLTIVKDLFDQESFLSEPQGLYAPIDYTLRLGGKRIRPVLLLAANQLFGGDVSQSGHAAVAIEVFHNFTLLHDDLMDRSPLRRGQPTVYRKWNENTAILSGDTMFALAWRYLLSQPHPNIQTILQCFCDTAIGVCEGQQMDMDFEQRGDVTETEYIEMIRLKTAVLLSGALRIGAMLANAPEPGVNALDQYGTHLGLAFQLQDDLLDAYGDVTTFGKQTRQDIRDNKKTMMYIAAMRQASIQQQQRLTELYADASIDPESKVSEVMAIYDAVGVRTAVENMIQEHFEQASRALDAIDEPSDRKQPLVEIMRMLLNRKS